MKNNALFSAGNLESFIFVSTPWSHSIPSKRLKGWKLQGERHSRKQITNCFTCKQPCWDHAASPESEQADTIPPRDELFWSSSRLEHEEHRSQQMFKPYSPSPPSSKGIFLFCFFFFFHWLHIPERHNVVIWAPNSASKGSQQPVLRSQTRLGWQGK